MRQEQQRWMWIGGACLLLGCGCAHPRSGPFLGVKVDDPPQLSPYNRSLTGSPPPPYNVGRPPNEAGVQLGLPQTYPDVPPPLQAPARSRPDGSQQAIRQRQEPYPLTAPQPGSARPPVLPSQVDDVDPARRPLALSVSDPAQVLVSEAATFQLVVRNPFETAAEEVVVECRFGDGLTFPGSPERALRQRLGTLGASESRSIDLSLTAREPGTQCVDFSVSAAGRETAQVQRCISCVEPTVMLEVIGPQERNVGGRLECVTTVANQTGGEVSGIVASVIYDSALDPREASAGAVRLPGRLEWDLGLLRVGERVEIQVEFACPTPTEQTCVTAEVTGRDLQTLRRELYATIHPRPTLDVAVADSRDPLPVGETTTYVVTVTNRGLQPLSDVRVDVEAEGGLEVLPDKEGVCVVALEGGAAGSQTATFSLAGPIAADDSRSLRIDVRGVKVGQGGLRVMATEIATERRVQTAETTVVVPPLLDLPPFGT